MIEKSRFKRITTLALPVMGAQVSQNVLNLIDTAMVGNLGNAALAAVGLGGFASFMCTALVMGISVGVQATASRRKGEGQLDKTAHPLNTGLAIVFSFGLVMTALLYGIIPHVYHWLNSDPEVIAVGAPYLRIRILALCFVGANFCFRGYWNAIDRPNLYMRTILIMHVLNICLNYLLIFGKFGFPELGVEGAAWGTSISLGVGTLIYFFLGFKVALPHGFCLCRPTWKKIQDMLKLSLPSGIQQTFFAAGFTAFYWILGKIGTRELAAANVMINIILLAILPALGLGLTAATLVGQALGRKDPDDAQAWGQDVARVGAVLIFLIGVPMFVAPRFLMGFFIHDPITLNIGVLPMQITGLAIALDGVGLILMNALQGAGYTKPVMLVSIFLQWVIFLPFAYVMAAILGYGLLTVWASYLVYRLFQTLSFGCMWKRGAWKSVEI